MPNIFMSVDCFTRIPFNRHLESPYFPQASIRHKTGFSVKPLMAEFPTKPPRQGAGSKMPLLPNEYLGKADLGR